MNDSVGGSAPLWFRIVAALGLVWNLFGVFAYLQTVGVVAGADPSMSSAAMPAWVTGSFAICVFSAVLGSLGLLLLRRWAKWLLALSFLCLLAQDLWAFVLRSNPNMARELPLSLAVNVIAILLLWMAFQGGKKGWLR